MLDMPYVFVDFNLTKMKNMRKLFLRADLLLVSKEKIAFIIHIYPIPMPGQQKNWRAESGWNKPSMHPSQN